ncbi:MAG TPA: hypothetical protein VJV75_12485 [Candidatus Polarisedimenticolia bacterium]|nr:hypothetical protein [Candidatus Polarisedimenticolia bacterium]
MRRVLGMGRVAAAALVAAAFAACAGVQRNPNVIGTYSDKLSPYNYREDGTLVRMIVGVDAARYIRSEPYFPLFVQVVNKSKTTFVVGRESFILEDSLGRQYGVAPASEVATRYPRLDVDRRLFRENRAITSNGIALFTVIGSDFYPSSSRRALIVDTIQLPPKSLMEDVLYFPIPESGLNAVPLRLLFRTQGLAEPIMVVFEVPKTLGILEKDEKDAATP